MLAGAFLRKEKERSGLSDAFFMGWVLLLLAAGNAAAGVAAPELQAALRTLAPGEEISVIVTLSDPLQISPLPEGRKASRRAEMIKSLRTHAAVAQKPVQDFLQMKGAGRMVSLWLINGVAVTARAEVIDELLKHPRVAKVQLDYAIPLLETTRTNAAAAEWNIDAIRARDLWALGYRGQGVVVASMDSGVDVQHPDLKDRWRGGTNSWFDPNGEHASPYDHDGHGTQTMGIMVGGNSSGTAIGVAPEARWIAVKIFDDQGHATLSAIHQGFQWLLDPDGNPETDDAPDIVNNSWGLIGSENQCIAEFQPDIQALKAAEIAVVFAAGNSGPNPATSLSPANAPESFAVGGVDASFVKEFSSSRGPSACDASIFPETVAPGVQIYTSDLSFGGLPGSYAIVSGTSFAAPHAGGAMALLLSAFPGASVAELEQSLKHSALDLGDMGADNSYGHGLIDVSAAYQVLQPYFTRQTLPSIPADDGWVRESATGSGAGGHADPLHALLVGDDSRNRQFKSIVSFDTSLVPADASLRSASLEMVFSGAVGRNPFQTHGPCYVDVTRGAFNAQALQISDFEAMATATRVADMSPGTKTHPISTGKFDAAGLEAINTDGITQARVYFALAHNSDNAGDYVRFYDGGAVAEVNRPRLNVVSATLEAESSASIAADDGWVRESSPGSGVGGGHNASRALLVGDDSLNRQFKSILSFDTSSIPPDAIITSATLQLKRRLLVGANPYTTHGACYVDIAGGTFSTQALMNSDFQATAAAERVAVMSDPETNGGVATGGFNGNGLDAVNKGGITQLRVYFSLPHDSNSTSDYIGFYSGESQHANKPKLVLRYVIP